MKQRGLEVYTLPNMFDTKLRIIVTWNGVMMGECQADGEEDDIQQARERLLCHVTKRTIGEVLKTIKESASFYDCRETHNELRNELQELHTQGDLVALGQFVAHNRERLEEILPPRNHRHYRNCRMKTDFVIEVGNLALSALAAT